MSECLLEFSNRMALTRFSFILGAKRTKEMSHEDAYPLRIAIDLNFDHLMHEKVSQS